MTNFNLLYLGAAGLALSDFLALATIVIWALNRRRQEEPSHLSALGLSGVGDEAFARAVP